MLAVMAADGISRVGNSLTALAIPWFVLVTTGSPALTGLAVFAGAVPVVISLFFGGAVVDRYAYRHVSIVSDLISGASVLAIPLLYHTVGLAFWQLLVLVFAGALFDIPASVARYSALPDLAKLGGVRFERANATFDAVITVAALIAPPIGGVLIAVFGASNILWIDAGSFAIAALVMAAFVPASASPTPDRSQAGAYRDDLLKGLRYVYRDPILFPLILFLAAMNIIIGPIDVVIIPVYAREVFDSAVAMGMMAAAGGIGALGGNLLFGWMGHRMSRRAIFFAGFLGVPLALAALALTPGLLITLGKLALLGLGLSLTNLLEYTIYFERIPAGMRARVLGISGAIGWCSVPIGRLLGGFLLGHVSLPAALAILAAVALPIPLAMFAFRAFRQMGDARSG
jgi:MFS family permease